MFPPNSSSYLVKLLSFLLRSLVSICIPSISTPDGFVARPSKSESSSSSVSSSSNPSDVTRDVATLNTDLASIFCEATDLLSLTFFECMVVMDALEEKVSA